MRNIKPILLVDDDEVDTLTAKRALRDLGIANEMICKVNGEEAIEYLRSVGDNLPCVILLDINMPKMDGFEFLQIAKADDILKEIPIIVLTTSDVDISVTKSFRLGAAGYIVKPVDYKQFVEVMKTINMYWTLSKLPNESEISLH